MSSIQLVNYTRKEFFCYAEESDTILQALRTTGWAVADDVRISSTATVSARINAGFRNIHEEQDIEVARQKLQALYERAFAKARDITTLKDLRSWLLRNNDVPLVNDITTAHMTLACLLRDTRLVRECFRDDSTKMFKYFNGILYGPFSTHDTVKMTDDTFGINIFADSEVEFIG